MPPTSIVGLHSEPCHVAIFIVSIYYSVLYIPHSSVFHKQAVSEENVPHPQQDYGPITNVFTGLL